MTTKEKILRVVSEDSGVDYETIVWAYENLKSYDHLFKILTKQENKTVGDFRRYVELECISVW